MQKASLHRGKGSAKHNEHNYKLDSKNVVIVGAGFGNKIVDRELNFYKRNFQHSLDLQNQKHIENYNYKRVKTIEQFYKSKKYSPTEEILQYGNIDTADDALPTEEQFVEIVKSYISKLEQWSAEHNNCLTVLNASCHFDETTPHCHLREVFTYTEDGVLKTGDKDKALELAGVPLPNPDEVEHRYNNRQMTFTKIARDFWYDTLEDYGYAVDRIPDEQPAKHANVKQYRNKKIKELNDMAKQLEEQSKALDARETALDARESDLDTIADKIIAEAEEEASRLKSEAKTKAEAEYNKIMAEAEEKAKSLVIEAKARAYDEIMADYNKVRKQMIRDGQKDKIPQADSQIKQILQKSRTIDVNQTIINQKNNNKGLSLGE